MDGDLKAMIREYSENIPYGVEHRRLTDEGNVHMAEVLKQSAARRRRIIDTLTRYPGSTVRRVHWFWTAAMTEQECRTEMETMVRAGMLTKNGQGRFYVVEVEDND